MFRTQRKGPQPKILNPTSNNKTYISLDLDHYYTLSLRPANTSWDESTIDLQEILLALVAQQRNCRP